MPKHCEIELLNTILPEKASPELIVQLLASIVVYYADDDDDVELFFEVAKDLVDAYRREIPKHARN